MRAFLAVPSEPGWVESTRQLSSRLREALPRASWTPAESWHLTLKFFEDISREQSGHFGDAVAPVAVATVAGEIQASGAVAFPPRGPARVLGVGFEPSETLARIRRLAQEAELQARRLGLPEERREFHPHVTLARLRGPWPPESIEVFRREVERWKFPPWRVVRCTLFQSRLTPEGAVHTKLAEWPFDGTTSEARA
ncbi:MAG TPA: RNA 2',3'-cyclic phosphodiesterase [Thermoanaerobaculia bacterium]|nr:RNA 2',3'-cyclic phosphodiesterase [Thermoanaerobaculia bacterium]